MNPSAPKSTSGIADGGIFWGFNLRDFFSSPITALVGALLLAALSALGFTANVWVGGVLIVIALAVAGIGIGAVLHGRRGAVTPSPLGKKAATQTVHAGNAVGVAVAGRDVRQEVTHTINNNYGGAPRPKPLRTLLNRTPKDLAELYRKNLSTIQADRLAEPFKQRWMQIAGSIVDLEAIAAADKFMMHIEKLDGDNEGEHPRILAIFTKDWEDQLSVLTIGDRVIVQGQVGRIGAVTVTLENAELVDDHGQGL